MKPGQEGGDQVPEADDTGEFCCVCVSGVCMQRKALLLACVQCWYQCVIFFLPVCPLIHPQMTFTCVRWRH